MDRKELIRAYKEEAPRGGVYAIRNTETGRRLLLNASDLRGARKQFEFAVQTGSCVKPKVRADWEHSGPQAFAFEVLEELKFRDGQTRAEYRDELRVLEELWREKLAEEPLY